MAGYQVDRTRLEALPTDEIVRILREERDDYTREAIRILEEILESRGVSGPRGAGMAGRTALSASGDVTDVPGDLIVRGPKDAVAVLNDLLKGVLEGTMEPQAAQVAANVVMAILRAIEQDYITESQEES